MRQDKTIELASIGPPRRVTVPVLVRDGKPCIMSPGGVEHPSHPSYSAPYNVTVTPYHDYPNTYNSAAYNSYNSHNANSAVVAAASGAAGYGVRVPSPYGNLHNSRMRINQAGVALNSYSTGPNLSQPPQHPSLVNSPNFRTPPICPPQLPQSNLHHSNPSDYAYKLGLCT